MQISDECQELQSESFMSTYTTPPQLTQQRMVSLPKCGRPLLLYSSMQSFAVWQQENSSYTAGNARVNTPLQSVLIILSPDQEYPTFLCSPSCASNRTKFFSINYMWSFFSFLFFLFLFFFSLSPPFFFPSFD